MFPPIFRTAWGREPLAPKGFRLWLPIDWGRPPGPLVRGDGFFAPNRPGSRWKFPGGNRQVAADTPTVYSHQRPNRKVGRVH